MTDVQFLMDRLDQFAHQYGAEVTTAALQVEQVDGMDAILSGVVALCLTVGLAVTSYRCAIAAFEEEFSVWEIGAIFSGIATFVIGVITVFILFDIWNWVAIFNPKLALAHDILQRVLTK